MNEKTTISWEDFEKVVLSVGKVVRVEHFPEARRPAYKLWIDFGDNGLGIKQSSAQITDNYDKESLLGKHVVCVTNFPPKQIGKFMSEVLVTGFSDANGGIVLATTDGDVPLGNKLI